MIQRESQATHIQKLQRELRLLHHQLNHKETQIQSRDHKIKQLQKIIAIHQTQPISIQQEQKPSQFESIPLPPYKDTILKDCTICKDREEMDVGLQLALQKDQELTKTKLQLQQKEQLINKLYSESLTLQKKMKAQDNAIDQMEKQILTLTNNNQSNSLPLSNKQQQQQITPSNGTAENVRSNIILQNIIIQNQKTWKCQQAKIYKQIQNGPQSYIIKKTINNQDWKLFCLQSQLQLANKDIHRLKEDSQNKDRQINQYQSQLQQLNNKLTNLEEQNHLLCEENQFFQMQISQKQLSIEELIVEIDKLKETHQDQQYKELSYSIKEKDDQLKEMTKFLKEKISQNHQLKVKCSQLQSNCEQLQRKKEKAQFQCYYLQQRSAQHEEDIKKQSQQIQKTEKQIKQLNSLSKNYLMRVQELQKQTQIMQTIIYDQQQKLSELNEQKNSQQKKIQQITIELINLQNKSESFTQSYQKETSHLNMLILTKDNQIEKIVRKMENLQLNLKSKEKNMQILQSELKTAKTELKQMKFINQRYQQELQQMQQVMSVNEEKLKILKRETVGNIQSEVNYEFQLQNAQKTILSLQLQKRTLQSRHNSREETITKLKKQLSDMHSLAQSKIDQINSFLSDSEMQNQETTTFQIMIMDDESFQVPITALQKQRNQIKKKINDYHEQMQQICSNSNHE